MLRRLKEVGQILMVFTHESAGFGVKMRRIFSQFLSEISHAKDGA